MAKPLSSIFALFSVASVALAIAIFIAALADYSRGNNYSSYLVEACAGENCETINSNEIRRLLNAVDEGEYYYGDVKIQNFCQIPRYVLKNKPLDANTRKFIEAFSILGLGDIRMQGEEWRVEPGKNTHGYLTPVKKFFLLTPHHHSCFKPMTDYYFILFLILFNLGFFLWFFGVYLRKLK